VKLYLLSIYTLKSYSHSKAVRAFSVAWKNAHSRRELGQASSRETRMYSDAVGNTLAMVFLKTMPSSGPFKNSQSIFWNKLLLLRRRS